MLTSIALPVALAAVASVSSVSAHSSPGHAHLSAHRSFKRFVSPQVAKDKVTRMVKRVKRGTSEKTYTTTAIWYAETGWVGSCGESFSDDEMIIALPLELYPKIDEASYLCGEKVSVTNDATGASITAIVADASQRADYTIFTKAAYEALGGDLDQGELSVTYKFAHSSSSISSALPESFSTSAVAAANEPQSTVKVTSTSITAAAQVTSVAKKFAAVATPKTTSATTTTTTSAPAATSSASSSDDADDEDDWICEDGADDETSEDDSSSSDSSEDWTPSSSSAAPAQTTTSAAPQTTTTTQAPQTTTTTTTSAAAATTSKVYDSSSSSNLSLLSAAGIKSFLGTNTNAIASWYHANSGQDSTNGNSWCYFPYNDDTPGIAISLKTMLANYGGDAMAARKAYCGLEAEVTTPDGTTSTLVVADAFDDTWVRTPTSIDVMYNAFTKLFGKQTSNKNDVIMNVQWKFTGKRNSRYVFDGEGN